MRKNGLVSVGGLWWRNAWRRRGEAFSLVVLVFLGVFLVVGVGLNRILCDMRGTGGFGYFTRLALPVGQVPDGCVGMRVRTGARADCGNLNRVSEPEIFGVAASELAAAGRTFEFDGDGLGWGHLDEVLEEGVIAAVADAAVIQWILKKTIGDEIQVAGSDGKLWRLRLVAGLKPSIFQGAVLVGEENFKRLFPDVVGYSVLLSDAQIDMPRNGAVCEVANERLMRFANLQNSYLLIFFQMGVLGLLLGLGGAGAMLMRNFAERAQETGTLLALGFSHSWVNRLYRREGFFLLSLGIVLGVFAGLSVVLIVRGFSMGVMLECALSALALLAVAYLIAWCCTRRLLEV